MKQDLIALPENWEDQEQTYELKKVHEGTKEWKRIEELMKGPEFDINIITIDRIQNKGLWNEYTQSQQRVFEHKKGEIELFHGTRHKSPAEVCEYGFGDSTREILGDRQGVYFAIAAKYADKYAYVMKEHRQMLLAKVITGRA